MSTRLNIVQTENVFLFSVCHAFCSAFQLQNVLVCSVMSSFFSPVVISVLAQSVVCCFCRTGAMLINLTGIIHPHSDSLWHSLMETRTGLTWLTYPDVSFSLTGKSSTNYSQHRHSGVSTLCEFHSFHLFSFSYCVLGFILVLNAKTIKNSYWTIGTLRPSA